MMNVRAGSCVGGLTEPASSSDRAEFRTDRGHRRRGPLRNSGPMSVLAQTRTRSLLRIKSVCAGEQTSPTTDATSVSCQKRHCMTLAMALSNPRPLDVYFTPTINIDPIYVRTIRASARELQRLEICKSLRSPIQIL